MHAPREGQAVSRRERAAVVHERLPEGLVQGWVLVEQELEAQRRVGLGQSLK